MNAVEKWLCLLLVGALNLVAAEKPADKTLPVRGFCIPAPSGNRVDEFIKVSCPWKNPDTGVAQVRDMVRFREASTSQMRKHFLDVVQTVWSGSGGFLDQFYDRKPANDQKNS